MRIVYVLTSLGVGGTEKQVLALASRMTALGHAVALIVLQPRSPGDCQTDLAVTSLGFTKNPANIVLGFLRAIRFMRRFRPDVVHSHNFHGNMLARLLHFVSPAAPVVSTIHNVYEGRWPRMLAYRVTDPLSRLTTTVCSAAAERYVRLKAVPQPKCRVLSNGIDVSAFHPDRERRTRMRYQLHVPDDRFIWLTAGRLTLAKDYPNLLRAFAQLRMAGADCRLWVAADDRGREAANLRALAIDLGLTDSINWVGLCTDVPELLDAADAFVLSSAWEGMPLALGEAMAMEKTFVATRVGGVSELAGNTGVLVAAKDPTALAQAMTTCMQISLEARQDLGRVARTRIATAFNIDIKVVEWQSLYTSLMEQ